mmetsp:Transcript_8983/g.33133  ORF Transcript_8983/g.33133 Transcript_8983/m.33133 type:complete len:428 (-) Transcript_8983:1213-2496(-)
MFSSFSTLNFILVLLLFLVLSQRVTSVSEEGDELLAYAFLGFATQEELEANPPWSEKHTFEDISVFVVVRPDNITGDREYIVRNETHSLWLYPQGFYLIGEEPERLEYVDVGNRELWKFFDEYDFNRRPPTAVWYIILGWFAMFLLCVGSSTVCLIVRRSRRHILKKRVLEDNDYDEIAANREFQILKSREREKWSALGVLFHLFYIIQGPHGLTEQREEKEKNLRGRFEKSLRLRYLYTLRHWVGEVIESAPVQSILLFLLLIDIILLMIEFTLEVFYPHTPGHHPPNWVETVELVIYILTVLILCTFELELFFLIFSFGLMFFSNPLYVMDLLVITTALLIEVIFREYITTVLSSLLTLMRLWRIGRIVQAVFLAAENRHNQTKERMRMLEGKLLHMHDKYRAVNQQRASDSMIGDHPASMEGFA